MQPRRPPSGGFTLIETIAVVLLIALVAAAAIPNLGLRSGRASLQEAESLGALLAFGRQRAVMTGRPQRVILDLDAQRYWLESLGATAGDTGEPEEGWAEARELPLVAPRGEETRYAPAAGPSGRPYAPARGVWLTAVETSEGRIERGQISVPFAWDGSSEATQVWIEADGGNRVLLNLPPLADRIGIERVDG
ncbi:MAG: prepilin-type N-terminal cleavage/methylation domain-containing protein [bacterium]|nr:prepilin-type N-terminal cleavage/methylation domain-containing protein [bacterium]